MALTEEIIQDKIEVVGDYKMVQVRTATLIKKDDTPDKWVWNDTDVSDQSQQVQAIANAVWTDDVKKAYKAKMEAQG